MHKKTLQELSEGNSVFPVGTFPLKWTKCWSVQVGDYNLNLALESLLIIGSDTVAGSLSEHFLLLRSRSIAEAAF